MKIISKLIILLLMVVISMSIVGCSSTKKDETPKKIPEGYVKENETQIFDEEEFVNIYNYAPSIFIEDGVAHIYYCSNPGSGLPGDHIAYRRGIKVGDDWYWSPKTFVLYPGEDGEWDMSNVCDPDVIKGAFDYNGETYNYLMTYLGCMSVDNSANSFGFAVAKNPEGPWIKVTTVSPLYDFYEESPGYVYQPGVNTFIWGSGQSSLISVDQAGTVLLFYTGGSTSKYGQTAESWDFSDLNNPVRLWQNSMSAKGIYTLDNQQDVITNAQLVYDRERKIFYMLSDNHPFDTQTEPINLPSSTRVVATFDYMSETIGDCFKNKELNWNTLQNIGFNETGYERVHNTCFVRDEFGYVMDTKSIDVIYTMSLTGTDWRVIYTYRMHRYNLNLY